jgi:hypothetical protein
MDRICGRLPILVKHPLLFNLDDSIVCQHPMQIAALSIETDYIAQLVGTNSTHVQIK